MTEAISFTRVFLILAIGTLASNQFRLSSIVRQLHSQINELEANNNHQTINNEDFEFHKKLTQETNIRITALENNIIKTENVISSFGKDIKKVQDDTTDVSQKVNDVNSLVENIIKKNILERASELSNKYKSKKSKKSKMNTKDRND